MHTTSLYRQLADHYLHAIRNGALAPGERMPSVRALMRTHEVSLSTALQLCRHLEAEGWLEARPRSGYFVRRPRRNALQPTRDPAAGVGDASDYLGIHPHVSAILARGQQAKVRLNLASAICAPELYPTEALNKAAHKALRDAPDLLAHPPRHDGDPGLRKQVARLALAQGIRCDADEVIVTSGCTEGLNLALRAVTQTGDTVAVESPTYFGLLQVLESLGLRALEIPTHPVTGISLDAMEFALDSRPEIRALVVMPNLQNPLGSVMPDAHKQRLVALCEARGIALIEDDTYSPLTAREGALTAAKTWDTSGNVIHCNSFNKALGPGLRLGWMLAGRWHARAQMLKNSQTRLAEEWSQRTVAGFLASSNYERFLRKLRTQLAQQRAHTSEAIAEHFPAGTRLSVPEGGLTLWVELPHEYRSEALFDAALAEGIRIAPGAIFSNTRRFDHYVRINCGLPFTQEVEGAIRRLGELLGKQVA